MDKNFHIEPYVHDGLALFVKNRNYGLVRYINSALICRVSCRRFTQLWGTILSRSSALTWLWLLRALALTFLALQLGQVNTAAPGVTDFTLPKTQKTCREVKIPPKYKTNHETRTDSRIYTFCFVQPATGRDDWPCWWTMKIGQKLQRYVINSIPPLLLVCKLQVKECSFGQKGSALFGVDNCLFKGQCPQFVWVTRQWSSLEEEREPGLFACFSSRVFSRLWFIFDVLSSLAAITEACQNRAEVILLMTLEMDHPDVCRRLARKTE